MSEINWGLASGPNSFQNALTQGFQIGSQIKQQREEKEYKNALAGYDPDNPETLKPVMQADPRLGMQLQQQQTQAAAQQQERRQADAGTMRKLLMHAKQNPQQAIAAAQQMGIDTSRIPQPDSPEFQPWVDGQLFIADAMEKDPEGLKGIAYELQQAGYQPGTPEFEQAARSVIQNKYATEYVDENGNTRRRSALNLAPQQGGPQLGAIEDGYRFKGGNPADPNAWEPVAQGGQTATPSATFSGGFRGVSGERVTSTFRSAQHNREVGGVSNSYHMRRYPDGSPMARDSVPPAGMGMAAYVALLQRQNPHLQVINEGDHAHMEPRD